MPLMPGTKEAFSNGWQNRQADVSLTAADFPDNYGVIIHPRSTRQDLVVIDADPRNYPPGVDVLAEFIQHFKLPMDTFTVQSNNGTPPGLHLYYTCPSYAELRKNLSDWPGIDVIRQGYVVGPGSVNYTKPGHPQYKVVNGSPSSLAALPKGVLDAYAREVGAYQYAPENINEAAAVDRFRRYLINAPVAVQGSHGDQTTFTVAAKAKDFGVPCDLAYEVMLADYNDNCSPPWHPDELKAKVDNAYRYGGNAAGCLSPAGDFESVVVPEKASLKDGYAADFERAVVNSRITWDLDYKKKLNDRGELEVRTIYCSTIKNVCNHFRIQPHNRYLNPLYNLIKTNDFNQEIEFCHAAPWHDQDYAPKYWGDHDDVLLRGYFSQFHDWNPNIIDIQHAVISYASEYRYHPIKDYLDGLEWDGVPRIDTLFQQYAGAEDNPYTRQVSKNILIAMVARIYKPGCKFDHVPVLEGEQGLGKGEFCKVLATETYHAAVKIGKRDKDSICNMLGVWVAELAEMPHSKRQETVDDVKAFLSNSVDRERLPYGRRSVWIPRQSVFIGTFNPEQGEGYLHDQTGNRRFWPIACTRLDLEGLSHDRDQLFAEAVVRFRAGEPHYLTDPEAIRISQEEQKARTSTDPWHEFIENWLSSHNNPPTVLTISFVCDQILRISPGAARGNVGTRIGKALRKIGYIKTPKGYIKDDLDI